MVEHRYRDPGLAVEARVADLLAAMTLAEKVAQLSGLWLNESVAEYAGFAVGADHLDLAGLAPHGIGGLTRCYGSGPLPLDEAAAIIGGIQKWLVEHTRLGIPALVHEECLTGLMAPGATAMPSPLNWGASFDPGLVAEMAGAIGAEMEAMGVHQGLAPVLDVVRDQRYGRVEECIAEDAYLVGRMGAAYIAGLQGPAGMVMATAKHFVGHAAPEAGHNTAPVHVGPRELIDVHLLPFEMAVRAGVASVMGAYHDLDGVPVSASGALLTGLLREQWGFDGVVVSDYWGVDFLYEKHAVAAGPADAARQAVVAGIDMELPGPKCYPSLVASVREGSIDEAHVDRAVTRVLRAKFRLGLFDRPLTAYLAAPPATDRSSARAVARRVAEASITLLSNPAGLLPLTSVRRLAVVGPNATSGDALLGNYSFANHVAYRFPDQRAATAVPSVLSAIAARAAEGGTVLRHAPGCRVDDDDRHGFGAAAAMARWADVAVVVVGDLAGHFGRGTVGEGSDTDDLALPGVQRELLTAVMATGTPTVVVHVGGRAHDLAWASGHAAAIVGCWFPGCEGAAALASVLFGDSNPGGRTPVTFSRGAGQQPLYYDNRTLSRQDYGKRSAGAPVFCFGHGLSYTTFEYRDLAVPGPVATDGVLTASCTVTNSGGRAGDEVVQLYVRDVVASVVRPVQQLRGFQRIGLAAGESAELTFEIPTDLLAFAGPDLTRIVEPGEVIVEVGASCEDIRLRAPVLLAGAVHRLGPRPRLEHRCRISRSLLATS